MGEKFFDTMNCLKMGFVNTSHSLQYFHGTFPIFSPEEDPGDVDEIEGDEPGKVFVHTEAK